MTSPTSSASSTSHAAPPRPAPLAAAAAAALAAFADEHAHGTTDVYRVATIDLGLLPGDPPAGPVSLIATCSTCAKRLTLNLDVADLTARAWPQPPAAARL